MRKEPVYQLQSVDRALLLIHLLRDQGSVTVKEASETLGVGASTAHRLLSALVYRDFAVQDAARTYNAGPALGIGAGPGRRVAVLRRVAEPHLARLRDALEETVNLSVLVGASVRIVAAAESTKVLHVGNQVGTILPAERSAAGKAELAWQDPRSVLSMLTDSQVAHEGRLADLLAELRRVRTQGYAVNLGEAEADVCAVGVPLHSIAGDIVGALSVAMPAGRFRAQSAPLIARDLTVEGELMKPKLHVS